MGAILRCYYCTLPFISIYDLTSGTNCKSWNGDKYVRCPKSSKCIIFKNESQVEKECLDFIDSDPQPNDSDNSTPQPSSCPNSKWRCTDGFCIDKATVCDGNKDCDDGSDEDKGKNFSANSLCSPTGYLTF